MNTELLTTQSYEVLRESVPAKEVAVTYLEAEVSKGEVEVGVGDPVYEFLGYPFWAWEDEGVFEFVRRFSEERGNGVYKHIANERLEWSLARVPVENVFLTRVNKKVNPVLEMCGFSLVNFARYLEGYYSEFPEHDDPSNLNEFRPRKGRQLLNPQLIGRSVINRVEIIDGNHRAPATMLTGGVESIKMYVANLKN